MTEQEIINLNVTRIQVRLKDLVDLLRPEIIDYCDALIIRDQDLKSCTLDSIDFNKSCIFICDVDIMAYVSLYALQKINKVVYPDTTLTGTYSKIRTNYMLVESTEIRYSKVDLTSVDLDFVPAMYKPTSYLYTPLCIWRLYKDVGQGDNENMYRFCNERLYERHCNNLLDWAFFIGTPSEFKATYNTLLPIPIYTVSSKKAVKAKSVDKAVKGSAGVLETPNSSSTNVDKAVKGSAHTLNKE